MTRWRRNQVPACHCPACRWGVWLGALEGQRPRVSRHDLGSRMSLCCRSELCAGDLKAIVGRGAQAGPTVVRNGWQQRARAAAVSTGRAGRAEVADSGLLPRWQIASPCSAASASWGGRSSVGVKPIVCAPHARCWPATDFIYISYIDCSIRRRLVVSAGGGYVCLGLASYAT